MGFDRQLDHSPLHWRSHVSDNGVEMRYVVLASVKSGGYSSVGVHSVISLRYGEGAGWSDTKAGEGFNAGMQGVADSRNHAVILTGQVARYRTEANAYGNRCHVT